MWIQRKQNFMKILIPIILLLASCAPIKTNPDAQYVICTVNNVMIRGEVISRGFIHIKILLASGNIVVVNRHNCKLE